MQCLKKMQTKEYAKDILKEQILKDQKLFQFMIS